MSQDQNPPARSLIAFAIVFIALCLILVALFARYDWPLFWFSTQNVKIIFGSPWQFPAAAARGLGVAAALLSGLFGLGYWMLSGVRAWRRMLPLAGERAALALPVAAAPVSLAVLALGLAGLARPGVYGGLIGGLFLAGLAGWARFAREMGGGGWAAAARTFRAGRMPALLLGALLALSLIYSLSPSVESDELRYHLAAPATWLREGRIHYLPYQAFSNFPMLGEMLFMAAMAVGGEEAAKPIHWAFLLVTMMLVGLLARRVSQKCGMRNAECGMKSKIPHSAFRIPHSFLAGAAFALMPMTPILAAWGFIDLFVTAYFLGFVYLTGRALARPRRASGTLIGLVAGGGCAVKYTMVALLGALGALWCAVLWVSGTVHARKYRLGQSPMRLALAVALLTALCAGPWYLKNFVWTGNPVYPLAWGIFHGGDWLAENGAFFLNKAHTRTGMNWDGAWGRAGEFLSSPFNATFFPMRFEENPLGPLPLMALVICLGALAIKCGMRNAECGMKEGARGTGQGASQKFEGVRIQAAWMAAGAAVSWAAWFFSYQSNRFLMPTAGLVLALGARAAGQWKEAVPRARWALRGLYLLAAAYGFMFCANQILGTNKVGAVGVALGFEERDDHLAYRLNYYRGAQWLARHARPDERTLLVGEYHTMHFKLPVVASDFFNTPQPLPWMRATKNNGEMLERLRAEGVRTIFYNRAELKLYEKMFFARFGSDAERERFRELWGNPKLKQVYPAGEKERGEEKREEVFIYEIE